MTRDNLQRTLTYVTAAILLFAAGWQAHRWYSGRTGTQASRRVTLPGFRFTSPLLDVELPEGVAVDNEPLPFKHKIASLVERLIAQGTAREITVYYRDMHDGPWFGINEDKTFNPASMMKVPVMIAWLKRAEKDPAVLKRTFIFDGREDLSALQETRPRRTITPGKRYTVDELLYFMMSYSDNNATSLLYGNLAADELNAVLDSMDVENRIEDDVNALTIHGYSGFFRILYNASFLNRDMSERALELLSHEDFPQGIIAGVPAGTMVASKFGEYSPRTRGEEKQLHEFGIIYHPRHPYILGIMTRGSDFAKLREVLAAISREVYRAVDANGMIGKEN